MYRIWMVAGYLLAADMSSPTMALCRPSIYADGRQIVTPRMWRLSNLKLRPLFDGSESEFLLASLPSGMFPGDGGDGRQAVPSCKRGGEDEGPDCVLTFSLEVLYAKFQDQVVIFQFLEFLLVICTATAWY